MARSAVRPRRPLRLLAAVALGLLLAEAVAFAAVRGTGLGSVAAMRSHRALLAAARPTAAARAQAADRPGYEVLQPYLGYVWDPRADLSRDAYLRDVEIGPLGFPRFDPVAPPAALHAAAEPLDVGLFGGSVAWILSLSGREPLAEALRQRPELARRPIRLHGFALPGYKQPQQLMTLAYLLSQGVELDVAINLDGVNEVVLPAFEGVPAGVHPSYPRSWHLRVEGLPDLAAQVRLGRLADLGERRAALARAFSRPVLERSPTWNLLWWVLDRRLALRLSEVAARPAPAEGPTRYAATGPPFEPGPEGLHHALARQWAEASIQMARLASGNGIAYLHFLQPNQYVPASKSFSREERALIVQPDHPYRAAVEAGYPELAEEAERLRREGVDFHDLRFLFADEPATVYVDSCCHLNALGNELLARAIGEAVVERLEGSP